ncbi:MAG: hypothetical protein ACW96X_13185, partial [Promethearchaeota archaeon]
KGFFGINVHDSAKWRNSSLGCTVLEPEGEKNDWHFKKHFKPLIKSISNKESVDYMVTNQNVFKNIARGVKIGQVFTDEYLKNLLKRSFKSDGKWNIS